MARVLLTGAFGTVGRWVLHELLRQGHEPVVLELDSHHNRKIAAQFPGVTVRWGDLRDLAAVTAAVQGQETVIHLGAVLPPVADEQPELATAVNVGGTRHIIEACRAQPMPPRLIHGSSGEVYGASCARIVGQG